MIGSNINMQYGVDCHAIIAATATLEVYQRFIRVEGNTAAVTITLPNVAEAFD